MILNKKDKVTSSLNIEDAVDITARALNENTVITNDALNVIDFNLSLFVKESQFTVTLTSITSTKSDIKTL